MGQQERNKAPVSQISHQLWVFSGPRSCVVVPPSDSSCILELGDFTDLHSDLGSAVLPGSGLLTSLNLIFLVFF